MLLNQSRWSLRELWDQFHRLDLCIPVGVKKQYYLYGCLFRISETEQDLSKTNPLHRLRVEPLVLKWNSPVAEAVYC